MRAVFVPKEHPRENERQEGKDYSLNSLDQLSAFISSGQRLKESFEPFGLHFELKDHLGEELTERFGRLVMGQYEKLPPVVRGLLPYPKYHRLILLEEKLEEFFKNPSFALDDLEFFLTLAEQIRQLRVPEPDQNKISGRIYTILHSRDCSNFFEVIRLYGEDRILENPSNSSS